MTYTPSHKMSDLATPHFRILLVLNRFGIGLGFGEKTIAEVCNENNVDVETFLAVANMLVKDNDITEETIPNISPEALITYLQRSHEYFLEFKLPAIRQGLENVLTERKNDLNNAVLNYFEEYVEEVRKHMM